MNAFEYITDYICAESTVLWSAVSQFYCIQKIHKLIFKSETQTNLPDSSNMTEHPKLLSRAAQHRPLMCVSTTCWTHESVIPLVMNVGNVQQEPSACSGAADFLLKDSGWARGSGAIWHTALHLKPRKLNWCCRNDAELLEKFWEYTNCDV